MNHTWTIETTDIKKVKAFLDLHRDDPLVRPTRVQLATVLSI
jgi:hypothetical protein